MSVSNFLFYKKQHKYRSLWFRHKFLKKFIKAIYGVRVNRRLPWQKSQDR